MCGICGIAPFDITAAVDAAALERMSGLMLHRGPDGRGFHREPGIGLGIRRLSIIDLETGDQPISSEDGAIRVVCNGEIYNYLELRGELKAAGHRFRTNSDVEVIVHLYEEHGADCLRRLRGMFGLALWDGRNHELLLARDRLGIKPLYYAVHNGVLYFASEQKSILAVSGLPRRLELRAMQTLFGYGFVTGPRTLCKGILRLSPGHYLALSQGELKIRKYWDVRFPPGTSTEPMSEDDWTEALFEKLKETVRLHLRSDVPIGAWLSGGIDSSGIVALMSRLSNRPVQTFSISFQNPDFDEVNRRRMLHQYPGYSIPNRQVLCGARDFELLPKAIWHCEDPSVSGLEIPRMMLSELTSRHVKVVLTGEGADEIFGAYGWFHADKYLRPLSALPLPLRRLMLLGPLIPRWKPVASRVLLAPRAMNHGRYRAMIGLSDPGIGIFAEAVQEDLVQAEKANDVGTPDGFGEWHPFNQLEYYELKVRLPDFVNRILDHSSMAHSVEARVPFLDHELAEFCARIPPSLKMRRMTEKYLLRRALRPLLPEPIVRRKKWGLRAPVESWLRGPLPEFAREMLSGSCVRKKGYFRPEGVARLIEMHRKGEGNWARHLMGVLVIQVWDEVFLRSAAGLDAGGLDLATASPVDKNRDVPGFMGSRESYSEPGQW